MSFALPESISVVISGTTITNFIHDQGLTNNEAINAIVVAGLVKRNDRRAAALLQTTLHGLETRLAGQAVKP